MESSPAWYYQFMGEAIGPLTASDLRRHAIGGTITPEMLVRRADDERWITASTVKGLFDKSTSNDAIQNEANQPQTATAATLLCPHCEGDVSPTATKCRHCGEFLYARPSTATVAPSKKSNSTLMSAIAVVCVVLACSGLLSLSDGPNRGTKGGGSKRPTYCDALQVLVDELDANMHSNIFGPVSCEGGHAYVTVEADYFVRLEPGARRQLLSGVRDQWVRRCHGTKVTFKSWDGSVVAEL